MNRIVLSLALGLALISCSDRTNQPQRQLHRFDSGRFPDSPVNMAAFNTPYDDYNSSSPSAGEIAPLCFSSNRTSLGGDFDIIYKLLAIDFSLIDGSLRIFEFAGSYADVFIENYSLNYAVARINTGANELGPYLIPGRDYIGSGMGRYHEYVMLYSNDEGGHQDIKFVDNTDGEHFSAPSPVAFLNSPNDDAYPCMNRAGTRLYFCSNRSGNFDIYSVPMDPARVLTQALSDTVAKPVTVDATLSSPDDDKCPFISGDLIVFTSNRSGGHGGYDLYYSRFTGGSWSAPVNFGPSINTAYDEYRPIVKELGDFSNILMIFSSNRPGGMGGFDLYYVGIDRSSR